jgi:hypothetical protein
MSKARKAAVAAAVEKSIEQTARRPDVAIANENARAVAEQLTPAIMRQAVEPVLQHLANDEPWYRSRVTWGAIISTAIPILSAVGIAVDWIDPDEAAALGVAIGTVIGGALTLYGRWKAKRPLGS